MVCKRFRQMGSHRSQRCKRCSEPHWRHLRCTGILINLKQLSAGSSEPAFSVKRLSKTGLPTADSPVPYLLKLHQNRRSRRSQGASKNFLIAILRKIFSSIVFLLFRIYGRSGGIRNAPYNINEVTVRPILCFIAKTQILQTPGTADASERRAPPPIPGNTSRLPSGTTPGEVSPPAALPADSRYPPAPVHGI